MTSAPVISNASPLIALHQIGQLVLLKELFGIVSVPSAVAVEVVPTLVLPTWVEKISLAQPIGPLILGTSLGPGESEAIALALETNARLVILDDRPARRLAQALRLSVVGTLGILLAAKRRRLLPAVRPCLDALMKYDFRITSKLYDQILIDADESF